MSDVIYQSGRLLVSSTLFRTARRSYRIRDIERITIKRPLFWFSVPLAIGSYLLLKEYSQYLFEEEKYICLFTMTIVPITFWFIGTLSITSKSYSNDDAITGFMPRLQKTRKAIESVIFNSSTTFETKENKHG